MKLKIITAAEKKTDYLTSDAYGSQQIILVQIEETDDNYR